MLLNQLHQQVRGQEEEFVYNIEELKAQREASIEVLSGFETSGKARTHAH